MNKYKNIKTAVDGITFDSKQEANRYIQLRLLERAGHISNLQCQVRFELIPKQRDERRVDYIADFVYNEGEQKIAEDVKGVATQAYILKRKLFKFKYPEIKFKEIKNEKK